MKPLLSLFVVASLSLGSSFLPSTQDPAAPAMKKPQKITTFLWFDANAEEAIRFYCSIFEDAKVISETRWWEGSPGPKGTLLTATFQLAGQEFMALNGGPAFRFNEAVSLCVRCNTQREIDELWAKLTSGGGEPGQCGWLKDRYGLSWQVVPDTLVEMLGDKDPARAQRVDAALRQMGKLDLACLKKAYEGR